MGNWNFEDFVKETYEAAWRYARYLTRDAATADDVVADTYAAFFVEQAKWAEPPTLAEVRTRVRWTWIRRLKKLGPSLVPEDGPEVIAPRAPAEDARVPDLERCLEKLPAPLRWCLMLYACWDIEHDDAAALLGLPRNAYNINRTKAGMLMRECMGGLRA
jgi:RNA polymerase sigma-70 factor (ECF subfamily)